MGPKTKEKILVFKVTRAAESSEIDEVWHKKQIQILTDHKSV